MADKVLQDKEYDLVSVIYNASQAIETCNHYIQDAQGDQEMQKFFDHAINANSELVQEGKQLLKNRLS